MNVFPRLLDTIADSTTEYLLTNTDTYWLFGPMLLLSITRDLGRYCYLGFLRK